MAGSKMKYPITDINDATGYNRKDFLEKFSYFCNNHLPIIKFTINDDDQKYQNYDTITKTNGIMADEDEKLLKNVFDIIIDGNLWHIAKNRKNNIDEHEIDKRVYVYQQQQKRQQNNEMNRKEGGEGGEGKGGDFSYLLFFIKIIIFLFISFYFFIIPILK